MTTTAPMSEDRFKEIQENYAHFGQLETDGEIELMVEIGRLQSENRGLKEESEKYKRWVIDLQSGLYVNCVYCGMRYGKQESTPVSKADMLKEHIEKCPVHPMSKLKIENQDLTSKLDKAMEFISQYSGHHPLCHLLNEEPQPCNCDFEKKLELLQSLTTPEPTKDGANSHI